MATSAEFWESSSYGPGDSNGTYEFQSARSPNRYHLTRLLRKRGMRNYGEILSTLLTDSSPSSTASVTTTQVDHTVDLNANNMGGVRGTTRPVLLRLLMQLQFKQKLSLLEVVPIVRPLLTQLMLLVMVVEAKEKPSNAYL